jgi:hypothetical protein
MKHRVVHKLWLKLLDRHEDGTKHEWVRNNGPWIGPSLHACSDYCHHYQLICHCGATRIVGYSVEEVR